MSGMQQRKKGSGMLKGSNWTFKPQSGKLRQMITAQDIVGRVFYLLSEYFSVIVAVFPFPLMEVLLVLYTGSVLASGEVVPRGTHGEVFSFPRFLHGSSSQFCFVILTGALKYEPDLCTADTTCEKGYTKKQ